jgi:hypothetical protein
MLSCEQVTIDCASLVAGKMMMNLLLRAAALTEEQCCHTEIRLGLWRGCSRARHIWVTQLASKERRRDW